MKIISGSANQPLAMAVAERMGLELTKVNIKKFADSEIFIEINENVRGKDVFIIQPTSTPANEYIMELMIMIDAVRRGSAKRITTVLPYYGYARQDRKTGPRTPITAKLVANMISAAGSDRVLTLDLHAGQIQGFFDIPLDNLMAAPVFVDDVKNVYRDVNSCVVVSPDVGGVVRARYFAEKLGGCDLAIVDKRRPTAGVSEVMNIIGDVSGKNCILIDDMVDSGGTLCNAATALLDKGAESVAAYCSHGVLSGKAVDRIGKSSLREVVITNSIIEKENYQSNKIRTVDISNLLAEACRRIYNDESISNLFK